MIHTSRIQSYRIQSCRIPYILSVFAGFHPRSGTDVSYHVFPLPYVQPVELTSLLHAVDKLDAQVLGSPFWDVARRSWARPRPYPVPCKPGPPGPNPRAHFCGRPKPVVIASLVALVAY